MPRYELNDRFWEATLEGTDLTILFGKIGKSSVNRSRKSWDSVDDAEKGLAKLVNEKIKQGFVLGSTDSAGTSITTPLTANVSDDDIDQG